MRLPDSPMTPTEGPDVARVAAWRRRGIGLAGLMFVAYITGVVNMLVWLAPVMGNTPANRVSLMRTAVFGPAPAVILALLALMTLLPRGRANTAASCTTALCCMLVVANNLALLLDMWPRTVDFALLLYFAETLGALVVLAIASLRQVRTRRVVRLAACGLLAAAGAAWLVEVVIPIGLPYSVATGVLLATHAIAPIAGAAALAALDYTKPM
ncbi:MAG TPA: hypothetical protein QGH10_20055 [Armatimonadota bacterium]|nr:hypothetical protein [Armatimonadota bacterium]